MSKRPQWGVGFQNPNKPSGVKENSVGCGISGTVPEALKRGGVEGGRAREGERNDTGESKLIIFMVHLPQSAWHSHTATKGKEKKLN